MKRITALLLAVILVIALVGCGKEKREIVRLTLSTEDAVAILAAAGISLPDAEEVAGVNTSIKWFAWYDDFHNYSEDEIINTGFWTFEQKYGGSIEWVECEWGKRFDDLANLILSDESPDFMPLLLNAFPTRAIKGLMVPVDDYIDYDDPLWAGMKYMADTFFSVGGKHYIFITDVMANSVVVYNRRIMDEWGFDDPAELFYNNEWTWDKMMEMSMDFTDAEDGRYAFNAWHTEEALFSSTGTYLVEFDTETGKYVSNIDDPRIERASTWLYDVMKNELCFPMWTNGWTLNFGAEGGGMKEGKTLFAMDPWYVFDECRSAEEYDAVFGDIRAGELMIVPVPRDPNGDGEYYIDSKIKGYNLINGAPNPEAVALLAACDRFKTIDPTVTSFDRRQLKDKKGWTEEMLDMWDTMYEIANSHNTLIIFGEGLGDRVAPIVDAIINYTRNSDSTFTQRKEQNSEKLEYYLDELNKLVEEAD